MQKGKIISIRITENFGTSTKAVDLCDPCSHLADLTQLRALPGLIHIGDQIITY